MLQSRDKYSLNWPKGEKIVYFSGSYDRLFAMSVRLLNLIVLWLFVSLFANAVTWAWQGEVFMHEIGDHQHVSFTTRMQQDHLHNEFTDHNN